jgi:hypothetical protein
MTVVRRICLAIGSCAVAGLAVTGCGTQTAGDGAGAGGTASTPPPSVTVPPSVSPLPPTKTLPRPTKTLPPVPAVTVLGVIEQGVEPGCYVLTPDRGGSRYLVITKTPPPTGVPVAVLGTPRPDLVSYCQQGTLLQVSKIELR